MGYVYVIELVDEEGGDGGWNSMISIEPFRRRLWSETMCVLGRKVGSDRPATHLNRGAGVCKVFSRRKRHFNDVLLRSYYMRRQGGGSFVVCGLIGR